MASFVVKRFVGFLQNSISKNVVDHELFLSCKCEKTTVRTFLSHFSTFVGDLSWLPPFRFLPMIFSGLTTSSSFFFYNMTKECSLPLCYCFHYLPLLHSSFKSFSIWNFVCRHDFQQLSNEINFNGHQLFLSTGINIQVSHPYRRSGSIQRLSFLNLVCFVNFRLERRLFIFWKAC